MQKRAVFFWLCILSTFAHADIKPNQLTIWINGDKGYNGLDAVAQRFSEEAGIPVTVAHPAGAPDKFVQAASTGSGPDLFFWPHDRYGEWAAAGLIAPVHVTKSYKTKFEDFAWDAMAVNGRLYGYPVSIESVSLIYNKDLIKIPPKRFEDIPLLDTQLRKQNKRAIMWAYTTPYFSYPLLSAQGGYAFKKSGSSYNVHKTGVANQGSQIGLSYIVDLIQKGHLDKGIDYGVMDAKFNKGEVAMMINGPWSWGNLEKSNINYGVAPLPTLQGKPARPFVGVLGGVINAASPNKDLAIEFLENYLLTAEGLSLVDADKPLGAVALKSYQQKFANDQRIQATLYNARQGEAMPSVAEMSLFWDALEIALNNATSERQTVIQALSEAEKRIVSTP